MKDNKSEKYQKIGKHGQGAYGVVYKAISKYGCKTDNETKEVVALKKIQLESEEEGIPSTAIRQISILKELNHPNVVKLVQNISAPKKITLVFEFLEYDLKKYMLNFKERFIDPMRIKALSYQLLRGIKYCHDKKIIHRDLKPQNLLIGEKEILKIADFGLARSSAIPTKGYTHEVVTLWYRPPDVLLGSQKYSQSIDIWSVGCIFAQMANLRPIFPGQDVQEQLNRIFQILGTPTPMTMPGFQELPLWNKFNFQERQSHPLKHIMEKLSDDGIDLLEKMLRLNPEQRISASEALNHKYFDDLPKTMFPNYK